ncbi:hypothetical protein [Microbispora rosea]|uniref:hypothetical protein n=1 Tax=Microbispora rosea TaxID=58117 RepID=UPI00135650CA|nr:hypothetical protein [Microbispora rosea]GIH48219.1 hypothetical protein Mro03_33980 [Microbispora rosea subsp. rosea]
MFLSEIPPAVAFTQRWYTYGGRTGWWFSFAIAYWLVGPNPCTNGFEIQADPIKGEIR